MDRLAEEFGADASALRCVASLYEEGRHRAPDIFVPVAGGLAPAFAGAAAAGGAGVEPVYLALGEWALDAEGEPIERMRRDCLRFQSAMTRSALRLFVPFEGLPVTPISAVSFKVVLGKAYRRRCP